MDRQTQTRTTSPPSAPKLGEHGVEGQREALLDLFARAGVVLSEDHQAHIQACNDVETLNQWISNAQKYVASDGEADRFELELHRRLGSRQAMTGWCAVLLALIALASLPFPLLRIILPISETEGVGAVVVVVLICSVIAVSYLRKASMHRDKADEIMLRIHKLKGRGAPRL